MKKPILALLLLAVATALTVPVLASPTGPSAAIGTPDAAPPAWTAEEMQAVYELNLVRRQPEVWGIENGVDLRGVTALPPLAPNNLLAGSADLVRHHHEYWDGTGYPDRLCSEQIPIGSRILSVAADYDAMVSQRPYHPKPLDVDEALSQIRRDAGGKYDPAVVEVFLQVIEEERRE